MRDAPPQATTRIPTQALAIVFGLVVWALWPQPEWATLLIGYGVAWLVLNFALGKNYLELPLPPGVCAVLALLLLASPLASLYGLRYDIEDAEGLVGARQHFADRSRLERLPTIAPPVLFTDQPQSFYVQTGDESGDNSTGAEDVSLEIEGIVPLLGTALGQGLFRIDYNPLDHGQPNSQQASLDVVLRIDDQTAERRLRAVEPQPHPRWLRGHAELGLACAVSEESDELLLLSRRGLQHRVQVADGPVDCVFVDDGTAVVVAHRYAGEIWRVDSASGEVLDRWPVAPFQARLAVSPSGERIAVALAAGALAAGALAGTQPEVRILDVATGQTVARVDVDDAISWLVFAADDRQLVAATTSTKELWLLERGDAEREDWQIAERMTLGRPAVTMARSLDGEHIYVALTDYRPSGEDHRGNHFIQDQILTVDVASWQVIDQFLTARRTALQDSAGSVDSGASPIGLAMRQDGSLLIAFAGSEEVWHLEAGLAGSTRRPPEVFAGLDLDLVTPHGVADLGDGYWAASSPAGGAIAIYDGQGEIVAYEGIAASDSDLFDQPAGSRARQALTMRAGERAFYEATRSGISCQSCHLHGASDHSPHNIGQKPLLPTLTTRGIAGTSPYLRDGSFPRVRDLNTHLAQSLYRGYRRYEEDRDLALEAFVETLPRPLNPRSLMRDLEAERAGYQVFLQARCDLCHRPPAFTNLSGHPVRALFPDYGADMSPTVYLDTPSLLGIGDKGHWLQDGRAHNLEEVLVEHNTANRHGDTAGLDAEQRRALVHFLKAL